MGDNRMGGIRNVLDGDAGKQGGITKSGESGGVAGGQVQRLGGEGM